MARRPPSRPWRRVAGAGALAVCAVGASAVPAAAASHHAKHSTITRAALAPGKIDHIAVVELENEGFTTTFGAGSPVTYLSGTLRHDGELLENYYAIGHDSLDNYIAQVSGQSPTETTQADCASAFANVTPGTSAADGQVTGQGCVYPPSVETIATQLDAKYPPNPKTHVASWRGYDEDMGITATRDGGTPDPTSTGTDCGHPAIGGTSALVATTTDQYATRHNPFVWFHSIIDTAPLCDANIVPLGSLGPTGKPNPHGHLARDFSHVSTTPRFAFITPNLCDDGHDTPCVGTNSSGTHSGGLTGAHDFLQHWMPLLLDSPAYRSGSLLIVVTFDEADVDATNNPPYAAACCHEQPGPNTPAPGNASGTEAADPGGGRVGAILLNSRYIKPGSVDSTVTYNHYSALRSYEDLLGLTTGGTDGHGHLGWAAAPTLRPFGTDVFNRR